MNKFCIKCGNGKDLVNEYCKDCFKEESSVLDRFKELKVVICNHCNNYLYNNSWKEKESKDLETDIRKIVEKLFKKKIVLTENVDLKDLKIKINLPDDLKVSNGTVETIDMEVHVIGVIKNVELEDDYVVPLKLEFSTCNNCKRMKGRYFEAKLQIRPRNEKVLKFVEEYCEGRKNLFISKVDDVKEGYDVYLSDQRETRNLGNLLKKKFDGKTKESKKIFGQKDGQDVYRGTVLFRLNE
jgi:nonsense-mediated mRNA decay protein 3